MCGRLMLDGQAVSLLSQLMEKLGGEPEWCGRPRRLLVTRRCDACLCGVDLAATAARHGWRHAPLPPPDLAVWSRVR